MLIEFKVENYRSIREEQVLSLVANSDKTLPANVFSPKLPGIRQTQLLKGAAIYGANASGKSNLIKAISFVRNRVLVFEMGAILDSIIEGVEPYRLEPEYQSKPSRFELTFVAEGIRYQYGFAVTTRRVMEEYLIAFPKGKAQRWYQRKFDPKINDYKWGGSSSAFKLDQRLVERTRPTSLFLPIAATFNNKQIEPVFNWFVWNLRVLRLDNDSGTWDKYTTGQLENPGYKERILSILRQADIGVSDIQITEEQVPGFEYTIQSIVPSTNSTRGRTQMKAHERLKKKISLVHKSANMKEGVALDFHTEESEGTQRLYRYAGPWMDIIDRDLTVFIDEIEASLHPLLVRELVSTLFSASKEDRGPQVVFTTHSPFLMDTNNLLRRDQIWFTEKGLAGETHLYPLTKFHPRQDEAVQKGYMSGRYGGIPFIPEGLVK